MRTFSTKSPKESGAMATLYFNPVQTKEILSIAGTTGLVLMQHYVAIAHQNHPNMEDSHLAAMLDMTEPTVKKVRLALTKAGWFLRTKTTIKGEKHIMYAVGKEAVTKGLSGSFAILP